MGKIQQACRLFGVVALLAGTALWAPPPSAADGSSAWSGPITRQPAAEDRLVTVINALRTEVYGLPALTYRPFADADIDYINCLVSHNRQRTELEHYPPTCGRTVYDGGAEVLAWNWNSLGGTTNDHVDAWNNSEGHRHLLLGTGDQVSVGVFCIGSTSYGVAWFRRADGRPAQPAAIPAIEPPGERFRDRFGRDRSAFYDDNTYVCADDGTVTNRYRPHSDQEGPVTTEAAPRPVPTTLDEVVSFRPSFTTDHADVLRLYQAFFGRAPDVGGADYWLDVLDQGKSPSEIAGFMSGSLEFQQLFGGASNEAFLNEVYLNTLGRSPDPGGFAYWLGFLNRGELDRPGIVFYVAFGDEFRTAYPFGGL